jgi:hypothetical protein
MLSDLAERLEDPLVDRRTLEESDVPALLNATLSFVEGRPVGSAQRNLTEVINTFLYSVPRHKYASIIRTVMSRTAPAVLTRESVSGKFNCAMQVEQDGEESIAGRVLRLIFPEIYGKVKDFVG